VYTCFEFGTYSVHLPVANAPSAADFFPLHDDGVYSLQSWINGEDLESAEEAIARMKTTVPIYCDLTHPSLTKFIATEEIGNGLAMIFEMMSEIDVRKNGN